MSAAALSEAAACNVTRTPCALHWCVDEGRRLLVEDARAFGDADVQRRPDEFDPPRGRLDVAGTAQERDGARATIL